jgi:hypothetical protein
VSYDFVSHYRATDHRFDYTWEERWIREQGYSQIIPEAVNGLLERLSPTMADVQLVFPSLLQARALRIARASGRRRRKSPPTCTKRGEMGAAHPLLMLVAP